MKSGSPTTSNYVRLDGKQLSLKANGLPESFGLFWATRPGNGEDKRYIYAKIQGRGLSCGTTDWKQAVRFVRQKREEIKAAEDGIPIEHLIVNDLLDNYVKSLEARSLGRGDYAPKTAKSTEQTLRASVRPFFGHLPVAKLIKLPNKMNEYRMQRTDELCAKMGKTKDKVQYTIDHEIAYLRAAYNLAFRQKQIPHSIIPLFVLDKKNTTKGARKGMFSPEQFDVLMETLPDYLSPMLAACNTLAVRRKEATFIHRSEVDWNPASKTHRVIKLREEETKAGKARSVGVPQHIWPIIWNWELRTRREYPNAEYLFHLKGERITTRQVEEAFNDTCEELGWHKPRLDEQGKRLHGRNGDLLYDRSPHWHDSRRTATTMTNNLKELTNVDMQRTTGMTLATQLRYDQNDSAVKFRDAVDRQFGNLEGQPISQTIPAIDKTAKLAELKSWREAGLIDDDEYKTEKLRVIRA